MSQIRRRIRRMCEKALPDLDFSMYEVDVLRPHQRDLDSGDPLPAWSIYGRRKSNGRLISVYSQDTMSDLIFWGLRVYLKDGESIFVGAADESINN